MPSLINTTGIAIISATATPTTSAVAINSTTIACDVTRFKRSYTREWGWGEEAGVSADYA